MSITKHDVAKAIERLIQRDEEFEVIDEHDEEIQRMIKETGCMDYRETPPS